MKLKISYILSILITTSIWAGQEELNVVKEKWIKWADSMVTSERDMFLKNYGLDSSCLNNNEIIELFKSNSDKKAKQEVDSSQKNRFYKIVGKIKNLLFSPSEDLKISEENSKAVKQIATEILKKYNNIEILNNPKFEIGDVGVFRHYKNNICYIILNCDMHLKNISQLKEILLHEYSHIIYEDNINEEIIQYAAWSNSNAEREEIEKQTLSYHRAFEARADVYAAINSPDHGKYLIDFTKTLPENSEIFTHPKKSDRIALLEKIKFELDSANEKKD